jgi:ABC-type transport system involved in cytochrome bd biosynthesis fused ATPase/permease subunit
MYDYVMSMPITVIAPQDQQESAMKQEVSDEEYGFRKYVTANNEQNKSSIAMSKDVVSIYNSSLAHRLISEKGLNLSLGQRQLLSMARAILKNAPVLILDEATSSADAETDKLIQDTVRMSFEGVTVVSIAHRLATISYYDKVIVMDRGRVIEFGKPVELLHDIHSEFYKVCYQSGDIDNILAIALSVNKTHADEYGTSSHTA